MLRLREVRKEKEMGQAELANRIGLSPAAIWKFESGEINPSLETLIKLAKALDCKLDDLVDMDAAS